MHSCQKGSSLPLFYEEPPSLPFSDMAPSLPAPFPFCCLFCLSEWVIPAHLMCYFLLNDIMDLQMSTPDTLAPQVPLMCFMQQDVTLLTSKA